MSRRGVCPKVLSVGWERWPINNSRWVPKMKHALGIMGAQEQPLSLRFRFRQTSYRDDS